MKCPECSARISFRGGNIACPECGWHPPETVAEMYALMPITNRRIVLGSASIFAVGLWYYAYYGDAVFLIPGFIGLALAPLLLAYRSWYVGRLMRDYQRVQS